MLLCRAAPMLLLMCIAAEGGSQAAGDSEELQLLKSIVHSLKDQMLDITEKMSNLTDQNHNMTAQMEWFNEQPGFKQRVENNVFNEDQPNVSGAGTKSMDSRVTDIEKQLQCSASEQLQVCKARERLTVVVDDDTVSDNVTDVPTKWVTVVVGGRTGNKKVTDAVQVFGGDPLMTLPNYPHTVYDNRMIAIGSKLYSCGGEVNGKTSEECFMIDMNDNNKIWQQSPSLARASSQHRISGANGNIMTIYADGSISVNNATIYKGFENGSTGGQSCLASNSTHSFFVHGSGNVDMNNNTSDPANWKNVAAIDFTHIGSYYVMGCFLFDAVLYITHTNKLFMINTDTFVVLPTAPPNTPRGWHRMGIIDGRVAVLGGDAGMKIVDSIETYDRQTDKWQTHPRKLLEPIHSFGIVSLQL